jgi:hypothetical protein
MNLSTGWSDFELKLISQQNIENIGDALATPDKPTPEKFYEMIDAGSISVFRCPQCDRLHLEGESGNYTTYVRQE